MKSILILDTIIDLFCDKPDPGLFSNLKKNNYQQIVLQKSHLYDTSTRDNFNVMVSCDCNTDCECESYKINQK